MVALCALRENMISIVSATNQSWKMNTFYLSLGVSGLFMFAGDYIGNLVSMSQPAYLNIAGTLLSMVSFIAICLSIKCPKCKDKWLWRAVSNSKSGDWLFWLKSQTSCPVCKQGCKNGT